MGNYSRQLIVDSFLNNNERNRARYLTAKAAAKTPPLPTETVLYPRNPSRLAKQYKLAAAIQKLDAKSRVYIIGHGDWGNKTLGGIGGVDWATMLIARGFSQQKAKLISVTGCNCARDIGTGDEVRVAESANSFASEFHAELGRRHVKLPVYARVYNVRIRSGHHGGQARGQKSTRDGTGALAHQRAASKVLFCWEDGVQCRKFVDYDNDDMDSWCDVDAYAALAGINV